MRKIKLGFILSNKPTYSETFLNLKFKNLKKIGYDVVFFSNNKKYYSTNDIKFSKFKLLDFISSCFAFIMLIFFSPCSMLKFLKLEKVDKRPLIKRWRNLFVNSRILIEKLDYLHFPFLTLTHTRENIASAIGAKMSASMRGFDISIYPLKHPGCYNNLWIKIDKLHSISNSLLLEGIRHGLPKNINSHIINPSIDLKFFRNNLFKKSNINNKKHKIHFLTVARLNWKKGLESTLEALAIFKEKCSANFTYSIIGDGIEKERLSYAVKNLGLDKIVQFKGQLGIEKVKDYYKKSDIYLQYSVQEGFCNSVLEAQAMGLLVIASNAEGLEENIIDGRTGWIVQKYNPSLLAEKIENIINIKNNKLDLVRKNAIERVNKKFNLDNQIKLFKNFYD